MNSDEPFAMGSNLLSHKTKQLIAINNLSAVPAGEETGDEMSEILGLHHVTAIAGDPKRNIDFYLR